MGKMTLMTALTLNAAGFADGVNDAIKETKDFQNAIGSASKETIKAFKDISTMGVGEMKRNLKELKNISFAGKSVEEIGAINKQIGILRDSMGDLSSMQKGMGTEFGNLAVSGIRGLAGLAEAGLGVAMVFGMDKKSAQELQSTMMGVIGAVQGLGEFQQMLGDKTLQVIAIRIREKLVIVGQTIAQTALNVATALGVSLMAVYAAAFVAVAAVAFILYKVITQNSEAEDEHQKAIKRTNEERKLSNEINKSAADTYVTQEVHIRKLVGTINSETTSLKDKQTALKELKSLDSNYLKDLDLTNISTKEGIGILNGYVAALKDKAYAEAAEKQLVDAIIKQDEAQRKLEDTDVKVYNVLGTIIVDDRGLKDASAEVDKTKADVDYLQKKLNTLSVPKTVQYNTGNGGATGVKDNKKPEPIDYNAIINIDEKNILDQQNKLNKAVDDSLKSEINTEVEIGVEGELRIKDAKDYGEWLNNKAAAQKAFNDRNKSQYELDALNYKSLLDQKLISETQYAEAIKEIEKQKNKANLKVVGDTFGSIAGLFKENTIAYKAMASAQALINAFLAASAAYASAAAIPVIGFVLGPIAYGAALASGLMAVASINGVQFANGGIVGGSSYTGDLIPARVNSGEMILNQSQQANLFAMANGGGTSGGGELTARVSGNDLLFVLNKTTKKINNTR